MASTGNKFVSYTSACAILCVMDLMNCLKNNAKVLLQAKLLQKATVIVTSRPSASSDIWRYCEKKTIRHLEIVGFTETEIEQFAKNAFSGDILDSFLSYITSNPHIYSMMYIPINAVIVAQIYQDHYNATTPKTMSQLFDALTRILIRRHLVSTWQVPRTQFYNAFFSSLHS